MNLKVLCVHGVGQHPTGGPWEGEWKRAIDEAFARLDPDVVPQVEFVYLDDIFAKYEITPLEVAQAIVKLAASGVGALFRRPKGLGDEVRWTAGMVVQWVEHQALRDATRKRFEARMREFRPQIVVAHSLGSLVCYDSFTTTGASLLKGVRFVSCGSQIGNPFVVGNFAAGRLSPLPTAEFWYHLFNPEDDVFTAELRISAPNFVQVDTFFDIQGRADHDVTQYIRHACTASTVWSDAVMALHRLALPRRRESTAALPASASARSAALPPKRALLVGINEYALPGQNLEGCVNDVFLMSALLQESGFKAEEIRIVLNDRATSGGVRDRLDWLLEDAKEGDTRFFYYSGHGAQLPEYGPGERVDRVQETLVLHDFDWTEKHAFTDDEFHGLYSQLPYGVRFMSVFDCCHSGGMTRAGARSVRGIDPPDDIRHRMLRWDGAREMWVPRQFASPSPGYEKKFNAARGNASSPVTHRLGQALALRALGPAALKLRAARLGHKGPYLPTLVYACREDQYAYEYQHGSIAHGAFTYSMVKTLRRDRRLKTPRLTFESLVAQVGDELAALGYEQAPTLVATSTAAKMKVPLAA